MKSIDFKKYTEELEPRIDFLRRQGNYIEAFLLICTVLERILLYLIEVSENWSSHLANSRKHKLNLSDFRKEEYRGGMTLGKMIRYFKIFSDDQNLISELEYFNKIRNKCVHKIFDENINQLDSIIKKDINRFYKLLFTMVEKHINIIRKENSMLKRVIKKNNLNTKNRLK